MLHADVELFFNDSINNIESITAHTETELNGGRIEQRVCHKTNDIDFLSEHNWPGLKSVFEVHRIISFKSGTVTTDEKSYYISSLDLSASELPRISHAHWGIERMRWMLDADFSEGDCNLLSENGQKTLNIFRKFALLLHKNYMSNQIKNGALNPICSVVL